MAKDASFDIVSKFEKAEMTNVFEQVKREIGNRYDFKGSAAGIEWGQEKDSIVIIGENDYHIDAISDMLRKTAATRGVSQKTFNFKGERVDSNLKTKLEVKLESGLDKEKAKKINTLLRDELPKVKTQVQGDEIRVSSPKRDLLQQAMKIVEGAEFDFATQFVNFK